MKIWYLKHPLSLYVESKDQIKKIARDNGFRIIDSAFGSNDLNVPKLTLVNEEKEEIVKEVKKRGRKPKEIIVDDIN